VADCDAALAAIGLSTTTPTCMPCVPGSPVRVDGPPAIPLPQTPQTPATTGGDSPIMLHLSQDGTPIKPRAVRALQEEESSPENLSSDGTRPKTRTWRGQSRSPSRSPGSPRSPKIIRPPPSRETSPAVETPKKRHSPIIFGKQL